MLLTCRDTKPLNFVSKCIDRSECMVNVRLVLLVFGTLANASAAAAGG
jgi:hypothetical protein